MRPIGDVAELLDVSPEYRPVVVYGHSVDDLDREDLLAVVSSQSREIASLRAEVSRLEYESLPPKWEDREDTGMEKVLLFGSVALFLIGAAGIVSLILGLLV